jgi:hypothetical protein
LTPSCHDTAPRSANLKRGIHQHPSSSMDPVSSMPVSWNRSSSEKGRYYARPVNMIKLTKAREITPYRQGARRNADAVHGAIR